MLRVIVEGHDGEGRSTLAALVAMKLAELNIPCVTLDTGKQNAAELLMSPGQLWRQCEAIAMRCRTNSDRVAVWVTKQTITTQQSQDFKIKIYDQWIKTDNSSGDEPRPHITAKNVKALEFIEYQRTKPIGHGENVFGPFYTGFGYVAGSLRENEANQLAFRLKLMSDPEMLRHLNTVQMAYDCWRDEQSGIGDLAPIDDELAISASQDRVITAAEQQVIREKLLAKEAANPTPEVSPSVQKLVEKVRLKLKFRNLGATVSKLVDVPVPPPGAFAPDGYISKPTDK